MKLTRLMILGLAFLIPTVSTVQAEEKPAAEKPAEGAEGEKKAKKGKKAPKKAEGEEAKKEAAPAK